MEDEEFFVNQPHTLHTCTNSSVVLGGSGIPAAFRWDSGRM